MDAFRRNVRQATRRRCVIVAPPTRIARRRRRSPRRSQSSKCQTRCRQSKRKHPIAMKRKSQTSWHVQLHVNFLGRLYTNRFEDPIKLKKLEIPKEILFGKQKITLTSGYVMTPVCLAPGTSHKCKRVCLAPGSSHKCMRVCRLKMHPRHQSEHQKKHLKSSKNRI